MSIVVMICKTPSLRMLVSLCPLLIAMIMIGVIMLLMILKKEIKPHDEYVYYNIESGFGEVMTLFDDNPTILEEC